MKLQLALNTKLVSKKDIKKVLLECGFNAEEAIESLLERGIHNQFGIQTFLRDAHS